MSERGQTNRSNATVFFFFQRFLVPAGGASESVSVLLLLSSLPLPLLPPWSSSVAMVLSMFWYLQQDSVHLWHSAVGSPSSMQPQLLQSEGPDAPGAGSLTHKVHSLQPIKVKGSVQSALNVQRPECDPGPLTNQNGCFMVDNATLKSSSAKVEPVDEEA